MNGLSCKHKFSSPFFYFLGGNLVTQYVFFIYFFSNDLPKDNWRRHWNGNVLVILDHSISNGGELQAFIIIKSKEKPCYNADAKLLVLQEENLSQNLLWEFLKKAALTNLTPKVSNTIMSFIVMKSAHKRRDFYGAHSKQLRATSRVFCISEFPTHKDKRFRVENCMMLGRGRKEQTVTLRYPQR